MEDKELLKKIGENIKKIRTRKKISQAELARKCFYDKPNMSRIESGKTNPTARTLNTIANALQVPVGDLLR